MDQSSATTQTRRVKHDRRGFPVKREIFEAKFQRSETCWNWMGARNSTGYGSYGLRLAHRVAYEMYKGAIPDGAQVCHTCDNRVCVNPSHLWLGSKSENMRDCVSKGRHKIPHFTGSAHPEAKLDEEKVVSIRREIAEGAKKRPTARKYAIDRATLRSILERRTWRHV